MARSDAGSIRTGEFVARLSASSLMNPLSPKTPPTPFALAFTRLNGNLPWTTIGATSPSLAPTAAPDFDSSPLPIPYDLGEAPQLRVEVFDMVDKAAGVANLDKQQFIGAAEFEIGEVIAKDYVEVTHPLENSIEPAFTSGRLKPGKATIAALELRGSMAALARYAKAQKDKSPGSSSAVGNLRGESPQKPPKVSARRFFMSADAYNLRVQGHDGSAQAPFIVYFSKRATDDRWKVIGRTRTIYGEAAPKFVDQFPITLYSSDVYIRVEAYNQIVVSDNLLQQQFVGATEVSAHKLLNAPGMKGRLALVNSLVKDIKPGEVTLRMELIDTTKTKIYFDMESGPIKRKGLASGGKFRLAYRLSSLEQKGWQQIHESKYRSSGEDGSGSPPGITVTATTAKRGELADPALVGSLKPDIRWERVSHRVEENGSACFKIEFVHCKKTGAAVESLGTAEMTLAQLRGLHVGEHIPVVLDKLSSGRLVMKHQERAESSRYFSLQLIYVESSKFKGEQI